MFSAPNMTGIMNSAPPEERGAASGMRATFQNTGMVLSIGVFFSLMIVGLSAALPATMSAGLQANGVPAPTAQRIAHLPPVGSLFAAFLGYNPMQKLLSTPGPNGTPSVLAQLPKANAANLTGKTFFPHLISGPFKHGLVIAFSASLLMCLIAAAASWLRGKKYVHGETMTARTTEASRRPGARRAATTRTPELDTSVPEPAALQVVRTRGESP
jgi:hypothetical protein